MERRWRSQSGRSDQALTPPRTTSALDAQLGEEAAHLCPDFGAAGKAFPVGANQAYELVALVDGRNVILGVSHAMRMADAIDEQGFDVRLQLMRVPDCRSAISAHASSGSSDSTAPAGLG